MSRHMLGVAFINSLKCEEQVRHKVSFGSIFSLFDTVQGNFFKNLEQYFCPSFPCVINLEGQCHEIFCFWFFS